MASTLKTQPSQQKGEQHRKKYDYCGSWGHNFAECRKRIVVQRREDYKPVATMQADSGTNISHARDMMINLEEIFGEQSRNTRQVVMKNLMSTKMVESTPVWEHKLKMMSFIDELDSLGG
ncbi:hypothetical protein ACH5RR_015480 [Cinchona calisaya]|uniref:Uncharacterized protein n=1 Tax=Cinchona calisaya TaxID=153742 RepID=A0ABD2ZT89_9GENT